MGQEIIEPLVSVIVPAYNRAAYLAQAIDSVLAQTYAQREIIVVDDGSTDGTGEMAAGYGARIHLIRQPNAGAAAARNFGIAQSRGPLIALLDSDDRWRPEKLARQVPLFADPRVGLVHGAIHSFRDSDGAAISDFFPGLNFDVHDLLSYPGLCTQTLVFRRQIFDRAGPFDSTFRTAEDWEWTLRAAAICEMRGVSDIVAEIRVHDQQLSGDKEQLFADSLRVVRKHRQLHGNCAACRRAAAAARRKIRRLLYRDLNFRARQAAARGHITTALTLGVRALSLDPAAILRLLTGKRMTQ